MLNRIVFMDFDGTITTCDSLIKFIYFVVGDAKTIWGMILLSPMLIAYKLKLIPNHKAKQLMLSYFFRGMSEKSFKKAAESYSLTQIEQIIRPKAMQRIKWHQEKGHKVVVVSASVECWLKPWCDKHHIDLIATRLESKDNKLTGKFATKNCHGIEKVNRIRERYDLSEYSVIYAYGDSHGDQEMLHLATEQYYQHFN